MIINKRFSKRLFNAILKAKKISKLAFEEEEFTNWCHTLNVISGLPYDVELLGHYQIAKYEVPNVFTDLVIPRKISMKEGIKWSDIRSEVYVNYMNQLVEYDMKDAKVLVPLEFNEITTAILGAVKKDTTGNTTKLTELNGEKAADAWLDKFADLSNEETAMVAGSLSEFIPVAIDDMRMLMKPKYYNQHLDVCLDSWIEKSINALRTSGN
jgi:hypothetical protein